MKKNMKNTYEDQDIVKLKPVFGLRPGVYLTVIYTVCILLILFLIIVYPGIRNYGSKVTFLSQPVSSAVFADDMYIGATPVTAFIEAGDHTFTIKKKGFETITFQKTIPGRYLFSWFAPKKITQTTNLKLTDFSEYLAWRLQTVYEWSFITDFSDTYSYPNIFSEIANDLLILDNSKFDSMSHDLDYFLKTSSQYVSSKKMYLDFKQAVESLELLFSLSSDLVDFTNFLNNVYSDTEEMYDPLNRLASQIIMGNNYTEISADHNIQFIPAGINSFISIPENNWLIGNKNYIAKESPIDQFPLVSNIPEFNISKYEVTESDFIIFLKDNPFWDKSNLQYLIKEGLVDENYLLDFEINTPQNRPIRYISWYTAEAYCDWYTKKYSIPVKLPTHAEWEAAAQFIKPSFSKSLATKNLISQEVSGLLGSVWEFCTDSYIPLESVSKNFYGSDFNAADMPEPSTEVYVKGGSWVNDSRNISVYANGSIPKNYCSEFIGFRLSYHTR